MSIAVIHPLVGGRFVLSTKPKPTVTTASTWDKDKYKDEYKTKIKLHQDNLLQIAHSGRAQPSPSWSLLAQLRFDL